MDEAKSGTKKIETQRLILREFVVGDAQDMFNNWGNDKDVCKYLSWEPHVDISNTKALLEEWVSAYTDMNTYNWAIELKETGEVIGTISTVKVNFKDSSCEIAYTIGKNYWTKGITTEAVKAVLHFFFVEIGFNRIEALHDTQNVASGSVLKKSGMTLEGTLRKSRKRKDGTYGDLNVWSILKEEYN